jgi:serine/threonine-protein kinase HipA
MIKVWTDGAESGMTDRLGERGSTFAYTPNIVAERAVSMTMPVRLQSWDTRFGLAPIFEMNLPEGVLRERLRLAFAKATGSFDDFDLLTIVGRSQVGRIRYTAPDDKLDEEVPFQSVDEILASGRGGDFYRYLIEKFATSSGISGVQPKVLIRDEEASTALADGGSRISLSYRGATHIVKFWEANQYPQLAANEYFCLKVAEVCGLEVPRYRLSEGGLALVVDRFDLRPDATYRGFEDFCVLNARRSDEKYRGSYETSVLKRFAQFCDSEHLIEDQERLFTLIALNCALRNGDAHLKNFGVIYDDVLGAARLAPVYDLVTTTVYLPVDKMALTMDGSKQWPSAKVLQRLGETRAGGTPARVRSILERIADAQSDVAADVRQYGEDHPEFIDIGTRMLEQWEIGRQTMGFKASPPNDAV